MKHWLLLLLIISSSITFSQDSLEIEWIMKRSSPQEYGNAEGWAIGTDDNDNIYWGVNQDMPGWLVYMDALMYKFDSDTNELWVEHAVTDTYAQQSYNLKVTDSLLFVGGRTCSSLGIGNCEGMFFTNDVNTGETKMTTYWTQGNGYEEIDGIHLEDDGIIVSGWSRSATTDYDVWILKMDYQGNEIWHTIWGSNESNREEHADGHMVVDDSMIYISGLYKGTLDAGLQGKSLIAKFDKTDGTFVDSTTYGRSDVWVNAENGLGMTTDGTFLYCTGYTVTEPNNWDLFLTKFDKNLNQIWHTPWGGPKAESARSVHVADDGSIYLVGNTKSYGNGEMDVLFLKFGSDGTPLWYKTWGRDSIDQTLDFHVKDNDFFISGKTQSFHEHGSWDAFLLKVNLDSLTSINEHISNDQINVNVHPNPFTDYSIITFDNPTYESHEIKILTLDGKLIQSYKNITSNHVRIEDGIPSGIYLYVIEREGTQVHQGKIVKQ
jgi:hypothetical protein